MNNFEKLLYLTEIDKQLGELVDDIDRLYAADSRDAKRGFVAVDEILKLVEKGWGEDSVRTLVHKHGLQGHGYD